MIAKESFTNQISKENETHGQSKPIHIVNTSMDLLIYTALTSDSILKNGPITHNTNYPHHTKYPAKFIWHSTVICGF